MIPLLILCPLIVLAALGAVWKARPVHAALLLSLALALVGVLYITQDAPFLGMVQFMVYVGGVAILIVFSLLITRPGDEAKELDRRPKSLGLGIACVAPLAAMLWHALGKGLPAPQDAAHRLSLDEMGKALFGPYLPAVLAVAVLLTVVLIGAALLARAFSENTRSSSNR